MKTLESWIVDEIVEGLDLVQAEPVVHALVERGSSALVELVLDHVTAHHERQLLADEVGKVDERRARAGQSRQDQDLRPVVLDVILHLHQVLHAVQRRLVRLRLCWRTPVHI